MWDILEFLVLGAQTIVLDKLSAVVLVTSRVIIETCGRLTSRLFPPTAKPKDAHNEIHPTTAAFQELLERDGAGSWPPRTVYGEAWPEVLRPYHEIYLELAPTFPCTELSTDDQVNFQRCLKYRATMIKLMNNRVNVAAVDALLAAAEAGKKRYLNW